MIFGFPQLYMAALYPNQDADICRDQVLHQHIGHLSALVTPSHADLKIPRRYQYECPWPAAQVQTVVYGRVRCNINFFRDPRNFNCVLISYGSSRPSDF